MILVSFSSAEDALSNDVQIYDMFSSQGTENPPFRFLGDTRYTVKARPEVHMDMILFEVFLKNIHLIPQDQIIQWHYL